MKENKKKDPNSQELQSMTFGDSKPSQGILLVNKEPK
jgi:hypothetical protein